MDCCNCKESIKNPDHNTIIFGGKKYCKICAGQIIFNIETVEIIAKPTQDVPEYPQKALSKDVDKIIKDNKVGELEDDMFFEGPFSD